MTKEFEAVHSAVDKLACALVAEEADSTTIADALIQVGLSLWAADSKRYDDAETLLRDYVAKRDAN